MLAQSPRSAILNRPMCRGLLFLTVILCQSRCVPATAKTILLSPQSDWVSKLGDASAEPGDEFILGEGVYSDPRRLVINQHGTAKAPVVIRAAAGAKVVFRRPDARQNTINLLGCQHLVLRDLEITGGSSGIRIGAASGRNAKFITLENLHIHHIGGVAVTANFTGETYESMLFRRNHIHHTAGHGEGFYLGSNNAPDGSTTGVIFNSVIEQNYIHHLDGPNVTQGDGIEIKDGSYNNVIRDNVIHNTNYPGIIVYGTDGRRVNVIERNAIWNSADHGIQAAADAIIRNNIVYDTSGTGIYCRDHQSAVLGNLRLIHNTVLSSSSVRIIAPDELYADVIVANNAWGGQVRIPSSDKILSIANVSGVAKLFPVFDSPCIGQANPMHVTKDDFNATDREDSADVGAYKFNPNGNPGWTITGEFKPVD